LTTTDERPTTKTAADHDLVVSVVGPTLNELHWPPAALPEGNIGWTFRRVGPWA
jgi:hypothetical protein